ncbi:hypothetical protein [Kineobactrum salinum]|uniref:DUF4145 domain-containing protein n=1 Tax=Kineobactrum salinum TaxID=2708301 RepID=A0A6C0U0T2_9GAMM|nr:hypothetical protein [Kineobactrum salinum]QIB65732.1 hypothetical protein G3T16_10205 [Kineobactrum salinum]
MNFLEFIASLVDSLAWPGVVCVFLWTFQERIGSLLPRLVRFKHKDTELEFSEAIERLERIEQPAIEGAVYEAEPNEQYLELLKIAEISPRAAVMEAWIKVETSAARAAVRAFPELDEKMLRGPAQPLRLLEKKVLNKNETNELRELRRLRNMAAHHEDFDLEGRPIEAYIDIALTMVSRLDAYAS